MWHFFKKKKKYAIKSVAQMCINPGHIHKCSFFHSILPLSFVLYFTTLSENICPRVFKISQKHKGNSALSNFHQKLPWPFLAEWILSYLAGREASSPLWGLRNVVSWLVLQETLLGIRWKFQEWVYISLLLAVPSWVGHTQSTGCVLWFHNRTKDSSSTGRLRSGGPSSSFSEWVLVQVWT